MKKLWALAVILAANIVLATPPERFIKIPINKSPFEIKDFAATRDRDDNFVLSVTAKNGGTQDVQALGIGFVFYTAFNELSYGFTGVSMLPGDFRQPGQIKPTEERKLQWGSRFSGSFAISTIIAFPSKARLADGTVWEADAKEVATRIQELAGVGFDPSKIDQP